MLISREESTLSLKCIKMLLIIHGKDSILNITPQQILDTLVSCLPEMSSEQRIKVIKLIMLFQLGVLTHEPVPVTILNKIREGL